MSDEQHDDINMRETRTNEGGTQTLGSTTSLHPNTPTDSPAERKHLDGEANGGTNSEPQPQPQRGPPPPPPPPTHFPTADGQPPRIPYRFGGLPSININHENASANMQPETKQELLNKPDGKLWAYFQAGTNEAINHTQKDLLAEQIAGFFNLDARPSVHAPGIPKKPEKDAKKQPFSYLVSGLPDAVYTAMTQQRSWTSDSAAFHVVPVAGPPTLFTVAYDGLCLNASEQSVQEVVEAVMRLLRNPRDRRFQNFLNRHTNNLDPDPMVDPMDQVLSTLEVKPLHITIDGKEKILFRIYMRNPTTDDEHSRSWRGMFYATRILTDTGGTGTPYIGGLWCDGCKGNDHTNNTCSFNDEKGAWPNVADNHDKNWNNNNPRRQNNKGKGRGGKANPRGRGGTRRNY